MWNILLLTFHVLYRQGTEQLSEESAQVRVGPRPGESTSCTLLSVTGVLELGDSRELNFKILLKSI